MSLLELRCPECGARVIVDADDLNYGESTILCPHCEELIELP